MSAAASDLWFFFFLGLVILFIYLSILLINPNIKKALWLMKSSAITFVALSVFFIYELGISFNLTVSGWAALGLAYARGILFVALLFTLFMSFWLFWLLFSNKHE
jgi:hypothetical protein